MASVIAGIAIAAIGWKYIPSERFAALTVVVLAIGTFFSPAAPVIGQWLNRLRDPSPRTRAKIALAITIGSAVFIYLDNRLSATPLIVRMHDEHSYLLQTRMLAAGRLWMPAHPLGDAIQSFHVLVSPVYTSIYFPGTALLNVPGVWLGLPHWLIPLLLAATAVGLLFWNISQLADGLVAAGCVALLLGCNIFRATAPMLISQPAMLFLGMLLIALWLRWRRDMALGWVVALGATGGVALITRPIEAITYCLPIGVAMLARLGRGRPGRLTATLILLVLPTLPFLALQLLHNRAATGHALRFASDVFVDRYYPGPMIGVGPYRADFVPDTPVAPLRDAAATYVASNYHDHQPATFLPNLVRERVKTFVYGSLPNPALAVLMAIGILAIGRGQRWVIWLPMPLSLSFYAIYVFFIMHYVSVFQPAVGLTVMLAPEVLGRIWPKRATQLTAAVMVAVVASAILNLRLFGGPPSHYDYPQLTRANQELAKIDQKPAVVFFHYGVYANPHEEPVYNDDVAWPDDAEVVRVHDLGPGPNQKTLDYFAAHQPERVVYWFDRSTAQLTRLGNVVEVARRSREQIGP